MDDNFVDYTDPSHYSTGGVRWCSRAATKDEKKQEQIQFWTIASKRIDTCIAKKKSRRNVQSLLNMICDRFIFTPLPPEVPRDIYPIVEAKRRRFTIGGISGDSVEALPEYEAANVPLIHPGKYTGIGGVYFAYDPSSVNLNELSEERWMEIHDFIRVERLGDWLHADGICEYGSDRYSYDYSFLGTINGKHYDIMVDTACRRSCDVIITGDDPSWQRILQFARNPYIDAFPEFEWVSPHQLLFPRILRKNPYI